MKQNHRIICRATGTADGITTVVASTADVDRYSDVVAQHWDLRSYQSNPVVVWAHDYSQAPVGKALDVQVQDGQLMARIQWDASDDNPAGQRTARQFAEGYMSAVSVGFAPQVSTQRRRLDPEHHWYGESGMVHGSSDAPNMLLEISAVPLPANPQALAQRASDETMEAPCSIRSEVLRLLREDEQVKAELAATAAEWSEPGPSPLDWLTD